MKIQKHLNRRDIVFGAGAVVLAGAAGAVRLWPLGPSEPVPALPQDPVLMGKAGRLPQIAQVVDLAEARAAFSAPDSPGVMRRMWPEEIRVEIVQDLELPDAVPVPSARPVPPAQVAEAEKPARKPDPKPGNKPGNKNKKVQAADNAGPAAGPEKPGLLERFFKSGQQAAAGEDGVRLAYAVPDNPQRKLEAPAVWRSGSYVAQSNKKWTGFRKTEIPFRGGLAMFRKAMMDERTNQVFPHPEALYELQVKMMRDLNAAHMTLVSGYRSSKSNFTVEGAKGSQHLKGRAFDSIVSGVPLMRQLAYAMKHCPGGVGYYPGAFIHMDVRPNGRAHWGPIPERLLTA